MAQAQNSTSTTSNSSQRKQSGTFSPRTQKPFAGTSPSVAGKQSRQEKRRRWAKKQKPLAKPVTPRGPEKEYLCTCHNEPARKPKAAQKEISKDPESGKMKEITKGLGHWHCATTGKSTKVTPRKAEPKTAVVTNDEPIFPVEVAIAQA